MNRLEEYGAKGAQIAAATFVVGFAMAVTVLVDYAAGGASPSESAAFVADNEAALTVWYLVIYVVFGFALVPLVLALGKRLRSAAPDLAPIAVALGLIWAGLVLAAGMIATIGTAAVVDLADDGSASAVTVWSAVNAVQNGVGGGVEAVGGAWVLLVSVAAAREGLISRGLAGVGVVSGVAGLVTVVPVLEAVGAVFGLGMIAWFVGVGLALRRAGDPRASPARMASA